MSNREVRRYWLKMDDEWTIGFWDGHCWDDGEHFGLSDGDYEQVGPPPLTPDDLQGHNLEQRKMGAADFRAEVSASLNIVLRPHIEGVFQAWLHRQDS